MSATAAAATFGSIHYKFKGSQSTGTVTFPGSEVQVGALKKLIMVLEKMDGLSDFELSLHNSQTDMHYKDDAMLVPNVRVVVDSHSAF
jgi:hypothetical protein